MTLTFTGHWRDIADEMRAMLNVNSLDIRWLKVDGESIPVAVPADPEPVADTPAPRTRRTKAPVQVSVETPEPVLTNADSAFAMTAPKPAAETTPIVEEPVPSVDAPVATQALTSEPGSDEPASGSATTASEPLTYEDMSRAVLALAKSKGPDAVKAALATLGLTTARGTTEDMWPHIVAAVQAAAEIAL
jgi:hypothetical protein